MLSALFEFFVRIVAGKWARAKGVRFVSTLDSITLHIWLDDGRVLYYFALGLEPYSLTAQQLDSFE